jgi:anion-transporting  ArsA/GET3 family ATPase
MNLAELVRGRRVVVCVGSGGVGKTTVAASIALWGALEGRRVLCLTIDPARRLAQSLGLSEMKGEEQEISAELFQQAGLAPRGSLHAAMLDTKRTFDSLVEKYASSPEARDRILRSRIYQHLSAVLAGTQEYMAMEKLYAVRNEGEFDLIVLDTPPTSNALDFLDAPQRMVGAIDSPAIRWFMQAYRGADEAGVTSIMSRGASFILRGLSRFTGAGFLEDMSRFVTDLSGLFGGFRERALRVYEAMRHLQVTEGLRLLRLVHPEDAIRSAGIRRDPAVVRLERHSDLVHRSEDERQSAARVLSTAAWRGCPSTRFSRRRSPAWARPAGWCSRRRPARARPPASRPRS